MKVHRIQKSRTFKFSSGFWVEIRLNKLGAGWVGVAIFRGKVLGDTHGCDYICDRRDVPRHLRVAIAEAKNPAIRRVGKKLKPNLISPEFLKAMRLGVDYGMGPTKFSGFYDKKNITS